MSITITQERFLRFEKMRKSGKMNMWTYDAGLCSEEKYNKCFKHFITDKAESGLEFEK